MRIDALRNRERLLKAARDAFVEQGVDVPLEDVAQRAGLGIATLYRRFPDRVTLMRAVALYVLDQVAAEARAALAEEGDSFRALAQYLHRSLDLRIAAVMPVLGGEVDIEHDAEVKQARDDLATLFEAMVRAARASGQLRTDVGLGDIGLMVIRLARPLPGAFPKEFDDAAAHRQLDVMLDGLRGEHAGGTASGLSLDDVLVANAGGSDSRPTAIEDITEESWRADMDRNLTGTFLTVKCFLPGMKERRGGSIITMSSAAGRRPSGHTLVAYGAAKAGVQIFTQDLAAQIGPYGIRANCLAPETILTDANERWIPADTQRSLAESHPLRRLGTPEDVAKAALFLASDESSWITGVIVDIAGGAVLV